MFKISGKDSNCKYKIMSSVLRLLQNDRHPPVFMCIGSDKVAGDILGPIVGELLVHRYNVRAFVYGTLNRPVNALNVLETHRFIRNSHPKSKVFAIDASLGKAEDNGVITVFKGGLKPGAALSKSLPEIGDYSLTANVNVFGRENIVTLTKTKFGSVYDLAENIAFGINDALCIRKGMAAYSKVSSAL